MKVCFVTSNIFSIGGEQRVVSVIASELQKNGYDVTILCKENSTSIDYNLYNLNKSVKIQFMRKRTFSEKVIRAINLLLIRINNKLGIFKNNPKILEKIICDKSSKKIIEENVKKEKYDVVIGVAGYFSLLVASIECNNIKKIGWQHSSFDAYFNNKYRYYWNQKELFKKLIPKLDKYIVLTDYDKKKFDIEWNIKCTKIYNPKSFSTEKQSNLDRKNFLAAGRFIYAKGFDMLIKSFKIFSKENKEWNLKIVGDGEERKKLIKLIKENELQERITLYPFTDDIQKYFQTSSALLMPSRWEGMPMIMLESLEMGVPIIAYDIPVVKEIIKDNKEGYVVEKNNIEKYAETLGKFVKNEENIKRLGKNAKIKSNEFSINVIFEKWKELLISVMK